MTELRHGAPLRRTEDERLLRGKGQYVGDIARQGLLHAVMVRAPHAHARIESIATGDAAKMPGVIAVFTADDLLADGIGPVTPEVGFKRPGSAGPLRTPRSFLVNDRVRFAGEPVAMIVAESVAAGRDAAEAVAVAYENLPAVVSVGEATAPDARALWDDAPDNIAFEWTKGDEAAFEAAVAGSHHVTTLESVVTRVAAMPLEPRTAMGCIGEDGRPTLFVSHQSPFMARTLLAGALNLPRDGIRIVAPDVGGSFGMKSGLLREDALVLWAARRLGRPVRWTSDRAEAFLSDEHARDALVHTTLGLDAEGTFTALKVEYRINIGAYLSGRSASHIMNFGGIAGVYRTPVIVGRAVGILTNTQPTAPYRGAGRPDATYAVERAIDAAARELGRDPFELRQQNLVPPESMPYATPFLFTYDCGEFAQNMVRAAELADYAGFESRREEARARGRLRGLGICNPIEVAAGPFTRVASDHAALRVGADGMVELKVGAMSTGQGIETALADVVAQRLGIPRERIRYRQGDTDLLHDGKGSGGSAALATGGGAVVLGIDALIARGREVAAGHLGCATQEIEFDEGLFRRTGTNQTLSLADAAELAEAEDPSTGLAGKASFQPAHPTYPNGCHICEVEIDPETGQVDVLRYVSVEDVGRVINPVLVEGQIHGGVAQGLGQAFKEQIVHDPATGQLLTGSFMDYGLPMAEEMPEIVCGSTEVPTKVNPLGVKGVGEAGTVGSMAAAMNAVCDALAPLGVRHMDMPATPHRVWQAIRDAGAATR